MLTCKIGRISSIKTTKLARVYLIPCVNFSYFYVESTSALKTILSPIWSYNKTLKIQFAFIRILQKIQETTYIYQIDTYLYNAVHLVNSTGLLHSGFLDNFTLHYIHCTLYNAFLSNADFSRHKKPRCSRPLCNTVSLHNLFFWSKITMICRMLTFRIWMIGLLIILTIFMRAYLDVK